MKLQGRLWSIPGLGYRGYPSFSALAPGDVSRNSTPFLLTSQSYFLRVFTNGRSIATVALGAQSHAERTQMAPYLPQALDLKDGRQVGSSVLERCQQEGSGYPD